MNTSKRNSRTGLTDAQFASHFAGPNSVSKYTLEEGIKRAKLRSKFIGPMLDAKVPYEVAAKLADQMVIDCLGE